MQNNQKQPLTENLTPGVRATRNPTARTGLRLKTKAAIFYYKTAHLSRNEQSIAGSQHQQSLTNGGVAELLEQ